MASSASATALQSFSNDLATLVSSASRSVVGVHGQRSTTSGFAWRDGLVVTCEESLSDDGPYEIMLPGGDKVSATLVGRDPSTDVAVLRHEARELALAPLTTTSPAAGSLIVAVGSYDGAPSAYLGLVAHVSGPWRAMRGGEIDARIDLDQQLGRSAEGGLALDTSGNALGMVVFGPRHRSLVIPAATIERAAGSLAQHGRIARGYLGAGLLPVRVEGEETAGIMVTSVDPKGPAAAAGLRQGDILVAWNDQPMRPMLQMLRDLGPSSIGTVVQLTVKRAGETCEVSLTIGERPAD